MSKLCQFVQMSALALAFVSFGASHAFAQDPAEQIEASPKGLIGLGLVGAEIGLAVPALAGLDETWSLVLFPIVGAAGGAIAGHFLIDENDNENAAVAVLATGMALLVPALIVTLVSTAYDPEDDGEVEGDVESGADPPDELDEVPEPAAEEARSRGRSLRAGAGLLRYDGEVRLGVPGVAVVPTYSREELTRFGGTQHREVRLSLFSGAF